MEKKTKQQQIKNLLSEGKSVKEIFEITKTNIAYIYKIKRETKIS
jgi:DNA-binding CsgD family transcriptional regulator